MLRFAGRALRCVAAAASTPPPDVRAAARAQENALEDLSPRRITAILDEHIVGQADAKRAVAVSLRNRWRRRQLRDEEMQREVVPKNMLLIGPTGVGKTEISRRMAKITDAPFIKVEATRYTEVGFKGKDVESIIEDLYSNAKTKAKKALSAERSDEALAMALDSVYSSWIVKRRMHTMDESVRNTAAIDTELEDKEVEAAVAARKKKRGKKTRAEAKGEAEAAEAEAEAEVKAQPPKEVTLEYFKAHWQDEFKEDLVTIEVTAPQPVHKPHGEPGMDFQNVGVFFGLASAAAPRKMVVTKKVVEAVPLAMQEALNKLLDDNAVNALARALAEEEGVVFIDEIDKVVADPATQAQSGDVSSTGVQQDLLPLIEGSNVTMKDGSVIATDNILFICSGAFHTAKTSDMIAELQGRLPVRVELKALTEADLRCILTEPKFNLLVQQKELLKTEKIEVEFTESGIDQLAKVTCQVNTQGQNIGARRLHTILERVMDTYSFDCGAFEGKKVVIDMKTVLDATEKLQKNVSLAKYLL